MFDPPGFVAYHPPQNVIVSDLMESYIVYYIGATNGDVGQLYLNEFPGTVESSRNLSVTYSGSDLAGADNLQYVISLQNGGTSISESQIDSNITVLGNYIAPSPLLSHIQSLNNHYNCVL